MSHPRSPLFEADGTLTAAWAAWMAAVGGGTPSGAIFGPQTAHYPLIGPATGSAANPTFRALVAGDIPALPYEASGAIAIHAALTTGVHGLAITAGQTLTVTTGGTLGSAAYTAASAYDAAGVATAAVGAHAALVTGIHGITNAGPYTIAITANTSLGGTNTGDNAANSTYAIGSQTQAYSAKLTSYAALAAGSGWLHNDGAGAVAWSTPSASDVGAQAASSKLTTIAGLSDAAGNFIVGSAGGWVAQSGATARTSLGLGTGDSPQFTKLSVIGPAAINLGRLVLKNSDTGGGTWNIGDGIATPAKTLAFHSQDTGAVVFSLVSTGEVAFVNNIYITPGSVAIGPFAPTAVLHLKAGTATANTAPLQFTAGTNETTARAGVMEYDGTNLFFTRAGTVREYVSVAVAGVAAPSTSVGVAIVNYYGASATNFLGTPNAWESVNYGGTVYKRPLYT